MLTQERISSLHEPLFILNHYSAENTLFLGIIHLRSMNTSKITAMLWASGLTPIECLPSLERAGAWCWLFPHRNSPTTTLSGKLDRQSAIPGRHRNFTVPLPRSLNLLTAVGCLWMYGDNCHANHPHPYGAVCVQLYHHSFVRLHGVIGEQSDNAVLL